LIDLLSGI